MGECTGMLLYPPGGQGGIREDPTEVGKRAADEVPEVMRPIGPPGRVDLVGIWS